MFVSQLRQGVEHGFGGFLFNAGLFGEGSVSL